jgi:hypothetical protein
MLKRFIEWLIDAPQHPETMLSILTAGGFIGIFLFATQAKSIVDGMAIIGAGLEIAFASVLIGGLIGFLFGIPRYFQKDQTSEFQENTNLEQISDWLTKILIGAGLVQITLFWQEIPKIAAFISPSLGGFASSGIFGIAVIFYFVITGFFIGYLWTRGNMPQFIKKHKDLLESGQSYENDMKAMKALEQALHPRFPEKVKMEEEEKDLVKIFKESSPYSKDLLYFRTDSYWKNAGYSDEKACERVIPIYSALIKSIEENADTPTPYYYYGALGVALMDKTVPDWENAREKLTRAIELRGSSYYDLYYDFRRAVCNIRLIEAGKVQMDNVKDTIINDFLTVGDNFSGWILDKELNPNQLIENWVRKYQLESIPPFNQIKDKKLPTT